MIVCSFVDSFLACRFVHKLQEKDQTTEFVFEK